MSEQINTKDIQPTDFVTRYKELGFNKVYNLVGGIVEWKGEVDN